MKRVGFVAIVRYAEIGVKLGKARRLFEESLVRGIRCHIASRGLLLPTRLTPGRVYIEAGSLEEARRAALAAAWAFGVHSSTPAYRIPNGIDDLKSMIPQLFGDHLARASSFAIRARRVEVYPVTSREIEKLVGAAVKEAYPHLRVDLEKPDVLIRVEVRSRRAYAYLDSWVVEGPGGLPYGVEGLAVVPLLECSDDELFAAWLAARRGARLVLLSERRCRRVEDFVERWVPCGDATLKTVPNPLVYAARLAERLSALPVYVKALRLPNGLYTVSPVELAPGELLEKLRGLYANGPTPR